MGYWQTVPCGILSLCFELPFHGHKENLPSPDLKSGTTQRVRNVGSYLNTAENIWSLRQYLVTALIEK